MTGLQEKSLERTLPKVLQMPADSIMITFITSPTAVITTTNNSIKNILSCNCHQNTEKTFPEKIPFKFPKMLKGMFCPLLQYENNTIIFYQNSTGLFLVFLFNQSPMLENAKPITLASLWDCYKEQNKREAILNLATVQRATVR